MLAAGQCGGDLGSRLGGGCCATANACNRGFQFRSADDFGDGRRGLLRDGPSLFAMTWFSPRAVNNHGSSLAEVQMRLAQHGGVDRVDILGAVETFAEGSGCAGDLPATRHLRSDIVGGDHQSVKMIGDAVSQGGLAGARTTTDENQPDRTGPQVRQSDFQVSTRVGPRLRVSLGKPDTIDFGSHHRSVADVKVAQRIRRFITGESAVALQEKITQIAPAEEFQIHRKECRVIDDVHVP